MTRASIEPLHPLVAAAAVSVIVFSLTGLAYLTGILPMTTSAKSAVAQTAPHIATGRLARSPRQIEDEASNTASNTAGDTAGGTTAAGAPIPAMTDPDPTPPAMPPVLRPNGVTASVDPDAARKTPSAVNAKAMREKPPGEMTAPAVYIHVTNQATKNRMLQLERALAVQGLRLAGVKVVETGPDTSDLRYFHDGERDEALEVQKSLLSLGLPVNVVKRIGGFEPIAIARQYEVWLAGDYQPSR